MNNDDWSYWVGRIVPRVWEESHPLLQALRRGIAVHHGGLPKQYRDLVEAMFRGKKLKVVIATGSLALGVNMPARTAVFIQDSTHLTPLEFRQMSGRAGRRGFDNIGHVVFFTVPIPKLCRLIR
jgi:superfamily II RNA helicase